VEDYRLGPMHTEHGIRQGNEGVSVVPPHVTASMFSNDDLQALNTDPSETSVSERNACSPVEADD
jgi:hypothetical protein